MRRLLVALGVAALLVVACGRYGPPSRASRPAPPAETPAAEEPGDEETEGTESGQP